MQSKKNIVLASVAFVICVTAGFFTTKYLKSNTEEDIPAPPQEREIVYDGPVADNDTTYYEEDVVADHNTNVVSAQYPEKPSGPKTDNTVPKYKDESPQTDKPVTQIQSEPVVKKENVKAKMTKAEFQSLLLNSDDNILEGIGNEKVSGNVRISVRNMHADELRKPERAGDVRDKIATDTWRSVRVISVESDPKTGQIISATIEPIYP